MSSLIQQLTLHHFCLKASLKVKNEEPLYDQILIFIDIFTFFLYHKMFTITKIKGNEEQLGIDY